MTAQDESSLKQWDPKATSRLVALRNYSGGCENYGPFLGP